MLYWARTIRMVGENDKWCWYWRREFIRLPRCLGVASSDRRSILTSWPEQKRRIIPPAGDGRTSWGHALTATSSTLRLLLGVVIILSRDGVKRRSELLVLPPTIKSLRTNSWCGYPPPPPPPSTSIHFKCQKLSLVKLQTFCVQMTRSGAQNCKLLPASHGENGPRVTYVARPSRW